MLVFTLVLALAFQQQQTPEIARLEVLPENPTVIAEDTLRLTARAYDAAGNELRDVRFQFSSAGGVFEGSVDGDGLVRSGSTGTIPVRVTASRTGSPPVSERVEVRMVPGPAERIDVAPQPGRLIAGQRIRLDASAFSAAGDLRPEPVAWSSSAPDVATIGEGGLLTAVAPGRATIAAREGSAEHRFEVEVLADDISSISLTPSHRDARRGDVIRFTATVRDRDGREITGLTPAWSFSPGQGMIEQDGTFVGYDAGDYQVTARVGSRSADATVRLSHRDVRRPVTVLGRLPRTAFTTEEVWVHPNGEVAYLGTGSGGDRMYAIDIRDRSNPVVTDSLVADTRRVNDLSTTPDGRYLVHTREGASSRRNGIVIAQVYDPRHPQVIAEFTDGVTAGVHSAFIYQQPEPDGRVHVYATNNGTGAIHIIDITDPYNPVEASRWRTPRPDAGRTLHDVDVQDGLAYLSYWNDGLVILDVGNGVKGGSPENPQFLSQFKYDLNDMYREVELVGGSGFIRGTHTAWRYNDYVFIADEVFPANPVRGARDASAFRAYGNLQVLDVSDLENPRSVAWYEPEFGGSHNIWVEDDKLYLGAYNGGFRIFDVSGELRGDLRAQGREIAHLNTADMDGNVANTAMTWGVVVHDGLAFVNDMYNGLWIVRLEDEPWSVPAN